MNKKTKIYLLADENGVIRYVGKTTSKLKKRLNGHLTKARHDLSNNHRVCWIKSLFKKGSLPNIILAGEVDGDGCREEIAWIKYFRDEGIDLINATDGGEGCLGYVASNDTRQKMRLANIGRKDTPETRAKKGLSSKGNKRALGYRHTPEAIQKIGQASKGNKYCKGYHHSMAFRHKMSVAGIGNKYSQGIRPSPETRKKLSAVLIGNKRALGKHHTLEARKKKSLVMIGNKNSLGRQPAPGQRLKQSLAMKEIWRIKKEIKVGT